MKKRLWLAIIVLTIMFTVTVRAEDASVWQFDMEDYSLDEYTGEGGDLVIPDTISECPVEIVGTSAFSSNDTITSLVFPETVKHLEGSVGGILQFSDQHILAKKSSGAWQRMFYLR